MSSSSSGILGVGVHLPRLRMPRAVIAAQLAWFKPALKGLARGQRTLGNWDEDALTLAVAAGRDALADVSGFSPARAVFASTTAPFLDRSNAGLMAEALGFDGEVMARDASGSQRVATAALIDALQASEPTLVCAADRRAARPGSAEELRYGDAGAAVAVGPGTALAAVIGAASVQRDLVDHYRTAELGHDYVLEDRWVRDSGVLTLVPETLHSACKKAGIEAEAIDRLLLPLPPTHGKKLCAALGLDPAVLADPLHSQIGETGAGHSLLLLAAALEEARPGEILALVGFGQGCDVLLLKATDALSNRKRKPLAAALSAGSEVADYLKLPAFSRQLQLDDGIRGEADKRTALATHFRKHRQLNAMVGSQCTACDTPHFPAARVCVSCRSVDQMRDYGFAHRGARVKSFTEDWLAATPSPPYVYGNVAFEGGGNAFLEMTDVQPGELAIGTPLKMHFRVKDFDDRRGFRRYFWKPAPIGDGIND